MRNILIFVLLVGAIYFFMRKFTVYRCPKCHSRHIKRLINESEKTSRKYYICAECGTVIKSKF